MKKSTENAETGSQEKTTVDLTPVPQTVEGKATPSVAPAPASGGDPQEPTQPAPAAATAGECREAMTLADHEAVIARALPHQEVVAFALLEIFERRLYRPEYGSFKAYLSQRWEVSRARGYQLLKFARLKRMSTTVGTDAPANERQTRKRDTQKQSRRGLEKDPVLRAMNYVADTFDQLPALRQRDLIRSVRTLLAEMEAALNRGERPASPR